MRVRFAPSPTGAFHMGGARTALFNWLYARQQKGVFILRIEDTDENRHDEQALDSIVSGLRWLGLNWDRGPDQGEDPASFRQSYRQALYQRCLEKLLDCKRAYEKDGAYYFRLEARGYQTWDSYLGKEVEKVGGRAFTHTDLIRGRVTRVLEEDFVLKRSNGQFGFHFTNVVDDQDMGITHVIRGEDHLPNTARHLALLEALGEKPPLYAHLPLILKEKGQGKMSKRDTGSQLSYYQNLGILPQACRNFLALLGWTPPGQKDCLSLEELLTAFKLEKVHKDAARFDRQKLFHLNAQHLRALKQDEFQSALKAFLPDKIDEEKLKSIASLAQSKARTLSELATNLGFFFKELPPPPQEDLNLWRKASEARDRGEQIQKALKDSVVWQAPHLEQALKTLFSNGKARDYLPILRYATTGQKSGLPLFKVLEILGKHAVLKRLETFLPYLRR